MRSVFSPSKTFQMLLWSCILSCISFVSDAGPVAAKTDTLDAHAILARMAHAYSTCKSYRDTGEVLTEFKSKPSIVGLLTGSTGFSERLSFHTAYVRPDRFRFEYKQSPKQSGLFALLPMDDHMIVCRDNSVVQTWWSIQKGVEKSSSLSMALAGATGVSGGSAYTVPALLMPDEIGGSGLTNMKEVTRADDAKVGNNSCFQIKGKSVGSPTTVWIEQSTYLILKIKEIDDLKDGTHVVETTTYDPVVNVKIAPEELAFSPPK